MATHISLIREGIQSGDWGKVCEGYKQVTGESIGAPAEITPIQTHPDINKLLKQKIAEYFSRMAQEFGGETVGFQTNTDGRVEPQNTNLRINVIAEDDPTVPVDKYDKDPDIMYHNVLKNRTPRRGKPDTTILICEKCGSQFSKEKSLILEGFGSTTLCDNCIRKKGALR